jgi:S-adenosylmethionine/arginine decarboxylase-like enzyme
MTFGRHFIIDANECEGDITNKDNIEDFINDLCKIGKMEKKGNTIFEYFEDNAFNRTNDLVGYSVCQIISLSSIILHINFISKTLYFDYFTCGSLRAEVILSLFHTYFKPRTIKKIILNRDAINLKLPFVV